MNRAFFIIVVPAILVAAAYLAVYWGKVVPSRLAWSVAAIAAVALVFKWVRRGKNDATADERR